MKDSDCYSYSVLRDDIISMILGSEGVVRFDSDHLIEVKPGRKSPIHVNFKNTLDDVILREKIADALAYKMHTHSIDYVCGVESGGSYFASRCSDTLGVSLALYRKEFKEYADKGRLVGSEPKPGINVAILDDTLVTGKTIEPVVAHMKQFTDSVNVYCILSYGLEKYIKNWLQVLKISPVFGMIDLISSGIQTGHFDKEAEAYVNKFIDEQKAGII